MSLIFLKSVRLSNAAREKMAIGQVVNLMANDRRVTTITTTTHTAHMAATTHPLRAGRPAGCSDSCAGVRSGSNRLIDFMDSLNAMLVVPTMLLVVLKLLFDMLGVAMLAGVLVLVVALVSSGKVMKRLKQLRRDQLKLTDARVKATNEALLAIRVIQSNSWETPMSEQIGKIRDEELRLIRKQAWLQAYVKFLYYSIQVMVALVSFTTFAALGGELRASDIFASIALFALLQRYLNNIPVRATRCHLSNLCYGLC